MKCEFNVNDIYINRQILQAVLYCNPFTVFNDVLINQINISFNNNKIKFDLFYKTDLIKSFFVTIDFNINYKKYNCMNDLKIKKNFNKFFTQEINCIFDKNFTALKINNFLNKISNIIFELLKYYQLVRMRVQLLQNSFILLDIADNNYVIGFSAKHYFNGAVYNYCLIHIYQINNIFIVQFIFKNTNSIKNMQINEIVLNDFQSIVALEADDSQVINDARCIIFVDINEIINVLNSKKSVKELLIVSYNNNFYSEYLMDEFSKINNYIYNIPAIMKFINKNINLLFTNINMYFLIYNFIKYFNKDDLFIKDDFNEKS